MRWTFWDTSFSETESLLHSEWTSQKLKILNKDIESKIRWYLLKVSLHSRQLYLKLQAVTLMLVGKFIASLIKLFLDFCDTNEWKILASYLKFVTPRGILFYMLTGVWFWVSGFNVDCSVYCLLVIFTPLCCSVSNLNFRRLFEEGTSWIHCKATQYGIRWKQNLMELVNWLCDIDLKM